MDGFINLNKPAHWTSHDCVARVRRLLNTKKVGHGGTLDPLAIGVLPLAVGRATRLLQYLPASKSYRAIIRFGMTTVTDDLEGEVLTQRDAAHLQLSDIEALLPQFVGTLSQTPPMYSAIQVQGKRLYDLARQGKTVDVPVRQVVVHQLTPVEWRSGKQPELAVEIECGPGTYIRSLARDLGEALGSGATLAQLTRTHSSGFNLLNSLTLAALEQAIAAESFVPDAAGKAVEHLRAIALSPPLARRWCQGQKLALTEPGISGLSDRQRLTQISAPPWQPLRILNDATKDFLGIGEIRALPKISDEGTALKDLSNVLAAKMVFWKADGE
ncbi:MAG: tRNA pseudouridine(55) synthase TruB [Phormidesmis sp.]